MLSYINFLAGIALMLLGIRSLRRGSERFFGARLRHLLQSATKSPLRSLVAGFLISILTPSSTAVALLSVEAINAGYLHLPEVLGLMLGANIGFTVTVQLLAFKFYIYYGLFFGLGIPLYVFSKRLTWRGAGQAIMGIGFLLLAIQVLSLAVAPMKDNPDVARIVAVLENHPVWLMWFAVLLKQVLQSATATIGIAIALCAQGVLSVPAAVAVVVGTNIGIGVTALIAGFRRIETRRMALGNLFFKLVGAMVWMPLLPETVPWLGKLSMPGETHDTQIIANAYTLFNVALTIIFLPLVRFVAKALEKAVRSKVSDDEKPGARYLDPSSLDSPALALGQATREILHMADHVRGMLRDVHRAFSDNNSELCDAIHKHDDVVDQLNNDIKAYITQLSERALTQDESRREVALLAFANELESIGDIADKNLSELAEKKIMLRVAFSKEGRLELDSFFKQVLENFEIAISAFASQDRVLAEQLLRHKHHINERERDLRNRHFHRLHAGLSESFETSAIHLDVLTNLKHINSHLTAVAYPILEGKPA